VPTPVAASANNVPTPKLKPKKVMAIAASLAGDNVVIEPASATPEQTWQQKSKRPSPVVVASLSQVEPDENLIAEDMAPTSNADGKSNLDFNFDEAIKTDIVVIEPVVATTTEPSWLASLYASAEASLRSDGVKPAPAAITSMPVAAVLGPDGSGEILVDAPVAAEGKSDSLFVNREGKGNLPPIKLRLSSVK
jgi:hypothetical protein